MKAQRTWTQIGRDYNGTGDLKRNVSKAIRSMDWQELPCQMAMSPGMAASEMIQKLRIPKASHVGYSRDLAPYGLVGIRGHYTNGTAEVYVIDAGSELVPVCTDFHAA